MKDLFKLNLGHSRIFGLDMLRFIAITSVMFSHGRYFLAPILKGYTEMVTIGGFAGVELFFVLSGFLIGGIFIKICDTERKLNFPIIWDFWKRRWFRTLPNYYLILIVSTFIALAKGKSLFFNYQYYLYYIFSQNLFTKYALKFFDESWSLTVEEWFYLTFPVNFAILIRAARAFGAKIQFKYILLFGIFALLIAGLLIRTTFVLNSTKGWDYIRSVVYLRLDTIIWGVLFAWINFYHSSFLIKYRYYIGAIGLVLITHCLWNYRTAHWGPNSFYLKTIYFTVTNFAFACFLPVANAIKNIRSAFIDKIVTTVSVVSYSMYLTHITITYTLMLALRQLKVPFIKDFETSYFPGIVGFVLFWAITMMVSILLYKYYEKPMTDLRNRKTVKVSGTK